MNSVWVILSSSHLRGTEVPGVLSDKPAQAPFLWDSLSASTAVHSSSVLPCTSCLSKMGWPWLVGLSWSVIL